MGRTVFDVFAEQPFEYLVISRGEIYGNRIVSRRKLSGILKISDSMAQGDRETRSSNSRIHAHPEDFADMASEKIIGNGVRVNGADYTIAGVSEGRNFDDNQVEHLTLTLERASHVSND